MGVKRKRESISLLNHLCLSSASVATATVITHPIDVVKVRLQIETQSAASVEAFSISRFISTWPKIYTSEGIASFYSGIGAALLRAFTYGGARIGLYEPIYTHALSLTSKDNYNDNSTVVSSFAALTSGGLASLIGNPFEVIKVRMQSNSQQYSNVFSAIVDIYTKEGISRFWRGIIPSMMRSSLLTVSQIGPYSFAKRKICNMINYSNNNINGNGGDGDDSVIVHFGASLFAGIVSTTVTSPVDVMKTRIMNSKSNKVNKISVLNIGSTMIKNEGMMSFFRGWVANYVRLGPQTIAIFVCYEQFCKIFDVEGF